MSQVVLFGSTGGLGREVKAQLEDAGVEVVCPGRAADWWSLERLLSPSLVAVVNCTAVTGLDYCFDNQDLAYEVNGMNAQRIGIAFRDPAVVLQVSTEMVFPCEEAGEDHSEHGFVRTPTVYGATKLWGEQSQRFILRLPLLFGPTNKHQIVGKLVAKALAGETVRVADDVYSTPCYIPDVAQWIVGWCKGENRRPITHLWSQWYGEPKPISLFDLVADCVSAIKPGMEDNVFVDSASSFPSKEPKPRYGGLSSLYEKPFDLEKAIDRYAETWK